MTKEKVIETMNDLPQNFELDLLLEKLIFIEKVEKGLEQAREGKTLTHGEVKNKIKEWQK